MPIRLLVVLCWLVAGNFVFAQVTLQQNDALIRPKEFYLKYNPTSVFESDGGLNVSGEYLIRKARLGFQLEVQPVLFNVIDNRNNNENGLGAPENAEQSGMPLGIKLRPEIRYYTGGMQPERPRKYNSNHLNDQLFSIRQRNRTYIAVSVLYKYVQRERAGNFDIFNGSSTPVFQQFAVFTDIKQVWGFDAKVGFINPISDSKHFFIEGYIGLGVRFKKFSYRNIPFGASEPLRNPAFFRGDGEDLNQSGASFPLGIKFSYKFY